MPNVRHSDLVGADLHPPGPHTHPDSDLSSFAVLDGRYYLRASVDALLADRQFKTFVTVGSADADHITDGVADNVQIQAAIDEASAAGGGTVFIKAGTYDVAAAILVPSNVSIQGEGTATVLRYANGSGFNGILRNSDTTNGNTGIEISHLKIDGNASNAAGSDPRDAIWFNKVTKSWVHHVYLTNCVDSAIVLDNSATTDCVISHNIIDTTNDIGIYVSGANSAVITDNIVLNTNSYGIRLTNTGNKECVVSNNRVYNCGLSGVDGILVAVSNGDQNQINGNFVIKAGRNGIRVQSSAYVQVTCNYVSNSDQQGIYLVGPGRGVCSLNVVMQSGVEASNTYSGIYLDSSSDWTLTGNRSGDSGSGTRQKYGIEEAGTSNNNVIVGNMLDRNQTGGALIVGAATVVHSNRGFNPNNLHAQGNVTGATTFNRANGDKITATLTGNITVTLTSGTLVGAELELILTQDATGSRTASWPSNFKKAGGTLTLSTGANAVDVIKMVWDGTNWREVSRALNQS
jgi:parallel beta-helix repeat protein